MDRAWDAIPSFSICVQETFLVCSDFSPCTREPLLFLLLYFDMTDLFMNLFCRPSGQS